MSGAQHESEGRFGSGKESTVGAVKEGRKVVIHYPERVANLRTRILDKLPVLSHIEEQVKDSDFLIQLRLIKGLISHIE